MQLCHEYFTFLLYLEKVLIGHTNSHCNITTTKISTHCCAATTEHRLKQYMINYKKVQSISTKYHRNVVKYRYVRDYIKEYEISYTHCKAAFMTQEYNNK